MSRENMLEAFKVYCLGHLAKHKANIENILTQNKNIVLYEQHRIKIIIKIYLLYIIVP